MRVDIYQSNSRILRSMRGFLEGRGTKHGQSCVHVFMIVDLIFFWWNRKRKSLFLGANVCFSRGLVNRRDE